MRDIEAVDPKLLEDEYAFQSHLGYRLTHWGPGYARFTQPLSSFLMNRAGIPHGGNYGVLLDTAMGYSGAFTGDPDKKVYALTLSLTVDFLAKAEGEHLIVEGEMVGGGSRTFFAEGRVFDESERLVARGSGVFQRREAG